MPRLAKDRFERLVHEHHAAVWRAARRVAGDDAAAADTAQEVFVRVLEGKEHLDAARSERATLCWLAARLAANARRSRRRRHDHEENAMQLRNTTDERDPAELTAAADLRAAVHEQVQSLPHELRVPLLMRCEDDLTLAAIGSALRVPTSTVHERIEAALQRVRRGLSGRGHAIGMMALPPLIGGDEPPAAPVGLEARLLSLGSSLVPVVAGVGRRVVVAVIALAGAVGIAFAANSLRDDPRPREVADVAVAADVADATPQDPQRTPVPLPPPARAADATSDSPPQPRVVATLHGTVHDADAWPVAGATVHVVAGGGYKPFSLGEPATTDGRGAFRVDVKATFLAPRIVRLVVREHGRELLTTGDLTMPPANDDPLALVLSAAVGSAMSRYECTVDVRDENGAPLAGVDVRLCGPRQTRPGWGAVEASGESGADGRAVLAGRGLGSKWLWVDGQPLGRRSAYTQLVLKTAGQHTATVTLARGGELRAEVTDLDGKLVGWCNAQLDDEGTGQQIGTHTEDGKLVFRGLGDGPFTLQVWSGSRSPARRTGLRLDGEVVRFRLKADDDLRDVGDHMAELHGAVFDASTGERLSFGPFDVDVMRAFAGDSTSPFDRIEPPAPAQRASEGGTFSQFDHTGLAPGRWTIKVRLPGYAVAAAEFELVGNEVKTGVRVDMVKPATVRGRVVDAHGHPVRNAVVFAVGVGALADAHLEAWRGYRHAERDVGAPEASFTPLGARTEKDGTFTMGQVPPSIAFRLVACDDAAGFGVRTLPVLRAGETVEQQDVRLEPR